MATFTSSLIELLPIILGGIIGFLASFATSHFGHSRAQKALTEERTRERLEELYKTLVQIGGVNGKHLHKAISHVHFATEIKERKADGLNPHENLELLVGLYFKNFKDLYEKFAKAQEQFSLKYIEVVTVDYSSKTKKEKTSICTDLAKLDIALEKTITAMQVRVSEQIKI